MFVNRKDVCCGTCQHWSGEREVEPHTFRVKCSNRMARCKVLNTSPRTGNHRVCKGDPCDRKDLWKPWVDLP